MTSDVVVILLFAPYFVLLLLALMVIKYSMTMIVGYWIHNKLGAGARILRYVSSTTLLWVRLRPVLYVLQGLRLLFCLNLQATHLPVVLYHELGMMSRNESREGVNGMPGTAHISFRVACVVFPYYHCSDSTAGCFTTTFQVTVERCDDACIGGKNFGEYRGDGDPVIHMTLDTVVSRSMWVAVRKWK